MGAAINELGGKVAPKFTWSSPHDAAWVSGSHSLSCGSPDEVPYLSFVHIEHCKSLTAKFVYLPAVHGEVSDCTGQEMPS